jgi:hypothetical protein
VVVTHSGALFIAGGCVPWSPFYARAVDLSTLNAKRRAVASPAHLRAMWMHGCAALDGRVVVGDEPRSAVGVDRVPVASRQGVRKCSAASVLWIGQRMEEEGTLPFDLDRTTCVG